MKAKKLLALAGVSVAGAFFLAACGGGSSNQATSRSSSNFGKIS